MSEKTTAHSYEEALRALEDGMEDIKVSSKYEGNEQAFKSFIEALGKNATCKALNLNRNGIGVDGAMEIAEALKVNTSLQELYLDDNEIGDDGAVAIGNAILQNKNTALVTLILKFNNIGNEGAKEIANGLKANKTLHTLNLGDNVIGNDGAKEVAAALKLNSTLQILDLGDNEIGPDGAGRIADALRVNKSLQGLSLNDNDIGVDGAKEIAEALKVNTSLQELYLWRNQIGPKGASRIADALKVNKSLRDLNLWQNQIGPKGASRIADALKVNKSLRDLNLDDNEIGVDGAKEIAEALKKNSTLQILCLYKNNIGDDGAKKFAEALKTNSTLQTLKWNYIRSEGGIAIGEGLKHNHTLTNLDLYWNKIGSDGAKHIANALKVNTSLQELNLSFNPIGPEGASNIADALQVNTSLQKLNLWNSKIGPEDAERIADALKVNKSLLSLAFCIKDSTEGLSIRDTPSFPEFVQKWIWKWKNIVQLTNDIFVELEHPSFVRLLEKHQNKNTDKIDREILQGSFVKVLRQLINGPMEHVASIWREALKRYSDDDHLRRSAELVNHVLYNSRSSLKSPVSVIENWITRIDTGIQKFIKGMKQYEKYGLFLSHQGIKNGSAINKINVGAVKQFYERELFYSGGVDPVPIFMDIDMTAVNPQCESICFSVCGSDKVMLFLDKEFFSKKWCLIEYFLAKKREYRIIPFLEYRNLPMPLRLPNNVVYQHLDGHQGALTDLVKNDLKTYFGNIENPFPSIGVKLMGYRTYLSYIRSVLGGDWWFPRYPCFGLVDEFPIGTLFSRREPRHPACFESVKEPESVISAKRKASSDTLEVSQWYEVKQSLTNKLTYLSNKSNAFYTKLGGEVEISYWNRPMKLFQQLLLDKDVELQADIDNFLLEKKELYVLVGTVKSSRVVTFCQEQVKSERMSNDSPMTCTLEFMGPLDKCTYSNTNPGTPTIPRPQHFKVTPMDGQPGQPYTSFFKILPWSKDSSSERSVKLVVNSSETNTEHSPYELPIANVSKGKEREHECASKDGGSSTKGYNDCPKDIVGRTVFGRLLDSESDIELLISWAVVWICAAFRQEVMNVDIGEIYRFQENRSLDMDDEMKIIVSAVLEILKMPVCSGVQNVTVSSSLVKQEKEKFRAKYESDFSLEDETPTTPPWKPLSRLWSVDLPDGFPDDQSEGASSFNSVTSITKLTASPELDKLTQENSDFPSLPPSWAMMNNAAITNEEDTGSKVPTSSAFPLTNSDRVKNVQENSKPSSSPLDSARMNNTTPIDEVNTKNRSTSHGLSFPDLPQEWLQLAKKNAS